MRGVCSLYWQRLHSSFEVGKSWVRNEVREEQERGEIDRHEKNKNHLGRVDGTIIILILGFYLCVLVLLSLLS